MKNKEIKLTEHKINKSGNFAQLLLFEMLQMVENKIESVKSYLPIIFTVVTSVLAFIFSVRTDPNDNSILKFYLFVITLLLGMFILLIICYNTKIYYQDKITKKHKLPSDYLNISTFWEISCEDFIKNIEQLLKRSLTDEELLQVRIIKQKTNEYRFKKKCLEIVNSIVIACAIILIVPCLIYVLGIINEI